MSIVLPIDHGKIPEKPSTQESEQRTKNKESKDMFMKLLVAEMQHQDPLEPTDNSQYVQQLYSMSQTESVLSVQEDVEEMTVKSLVGKFVSVRDPKNESFGEGKVDSVAKLDGVWKISINGEVYPASGIQEIHDTEYYLTVTTAEALKGMIDKLPLEENLGLSDKADLENAVKVFNSLSDRGKGFLTIDAVKKLNALVARMNVLTKADEGNSGS